ncbi:alpha-hydroxy-acid oxidizing protein [Lysinibacillus yapensis]|uniref:L-lactate oxidase n=2 Tax=Ureibacillus yapensis TaxID=2304605 RepID=A0A396SAE7_9BACL|nr:alpha-hydroxy-acid oxidizing protein [Lysinibacillus yapensis]
MENQSIEIIDTDNEKMFPITYKDLEAMVEEKLPKGNYEYIRGGAGSEQTMRNNRIAFESYSLVPQLLKDTSQVNTSISLFNRTHPTPFIFAPVGMNLLEHPDGELAVAKAASNLNMPYSLSTLSSYSLEEVAQVAPNSTKFFQVYWSVNEELSLSMISRAEDAGYKAIILTIDTTTMGWREGDLKQNFSPISQGYAKGNYINDPIFQMNLTNGTYENYIDGILKNLHHPHLTWAHVEKLKKYTNLPVLLKGILHPNDALKALESGIDGFIVSNHGGRQLDGVIGSLDALPDIVKHVNGKVPVLFDSGIYSGVDAFKALALGADAVCIGRPYVYGLVIAGEQGVERVMTNIYNELVTTMKLAGVRSIDELRKIELVKRKSHI